MDDFILKLINSNDEELENLVNSRITSLLSENKGARYNINIKPLTSFKPLLEQKPVAYRYTLDSEKTEIYINGGFDEGISYYFDATEELCKSLTKKIKSHKVQNFEELSKLVAETIFEYIGGAEVSGTASDRLTHLVTQDKLADDEKNYISAFKGTQHAWCFERASMAHQLFKFLGYECELAISPLIVDGKSDLHAFNLIKLNDRVVLFDATMLDYSKNNPSETCIVFDNLPLSCYDNLQNIPERVFHSKNNERRCTINPSNISAKILSSSTEIAPTL